MTGDSLTVATAVHPDLGNRTVWLHFLAASALNSTDQISVATHVHAIELLRENVDAALKAAASILEQARLDPLLRWSVVNTVAAIKHEACIEFLHEQATVDFGERNPEVCGELRDSDVLVGIMAAEGLGHVASAGNERALEALRSIIRHQREPSVREAAGQLLLGCLKQTKQTPPTDIAAELERIGALRALVVDDVVVDPAEINIQQPKRVSAPKPTLNGGSVSPPTYSADEDGSHRG